MINLPLGDVVLTTDLLVSCPVSFLLSNVMTANLFSELSPNLPDELVTTLLDANEVRIERIVSHGQCSPEDFWYDQEQHEWVVLLKGAAQLSFESHTVRLQPGDFVNIPAHAKHRVAWTTPDEPTIWLAVHYGAT